MSAHPQEVPADFAVHVLAPGEAATDRVTCGQCGRSWDDAIGTSWTPAPSGRCPFEYFHDDEDDDENPSYEQREIDDLTPPGNDDHYRLKIMGGVMGNGLSQTKWLSISASQLTAIRAILG